MVALVAIMLFGLLGGPGKTSDAAPDPTGDGTVDSTAEGAGKAAGKVAVMGAGAEETRSHVYADEPARPRALSISAPRRALAGKPLRITGSIRVRAAGNTRAVHLVAKSPGRGKRWRSLGAVRTDSDGSFRFVVPAGKAGTARVYRVRAPREDGLRRLKSNKRTVRVVRSGGAASPGGAAGSSSDWTWLFGDESGRWDPCTPIRWAYNGTGSYSGSLKDMKRAFAKIAAETGLRFTYTGSTNYIPYTDRTPPSNVDLNVGWATERQVAGLSGSTVGLGGASGSGVDGADVDYRLQNGAVVFDREARLRTGYANTGSPTWGQVMLHEALHALGLGHARGERQVMFGSVHSNNHHFGAGDLGGMRRIGSGGGCLPQ